MSRELAVGDTLPPADFTVDDWRMKVFALLMADPNPIHFDPAYVAALGRGDRPVNQGTLTVALPLDALIAWLGGEDASARIAHVDCRFTGSAVAGDVVTAGGRVVAVDATGDATVELWVDRGDTDRILTGRAVVRPPRPDADCRAGALHSDLT